MEILSSHLLALGSNSFTHSIAFVQSIFVMEAFNPTLGGSYVLWGLGFVLLYCGSTVSMRFTDDKVPLVGLRSIFELRLMANFRFFRNAAIILNDEYSENKDTIFKFARADTDMLILPPKYVDELRTLLASMPLRFARTLEA